MKQSYTTSFRDFKDAQHLHLRANPRTAATFWIFLRIFPVIAILLSIWLWRELPALKNPVAATVVFSLIGVGGWGLIMALLRPLSLRRLYKRMKNGRSDDHLLEIEIAENQLISRVTGVSEGRFLPNALNRFIEDDQMALLYASPRVFVMLPKRVMNEESWTELRAWLVAGNVPMKEIRS